MKTRGLVYALVLTLCVGAGWANGQDTIYVSQDGFCGGHSLCYSMIQDGIDSVSLPSIIRITQEMYHEDVVLDVNQIIALEGGWDTGFTSCSSSTIISGSVTISGGTMIIGGTGRIVLSSLPPGVTVCETLAPLVSGTCEATPGSGGLLITGDVLTPTGVLRGGQVLVDATGQIACVSCECSAPSGVAEVSCPTGVISPGLVNTLDHLTYANNVPFTDTGERYEQRHDWRKGLNGHTTLTFNGGASTTQMLWSELRFLLAGATSTTGRGGGAPGFLRNLDSSMADIALQEGLNHTPTSFDTFPLGDSDGTRLSEGCNYPDITPLTEIQGLTAWVAQAAEGVDASARNEFLCMSSTANGGQDLLQPQATFVGGMALKPEDFAAMGSRGTSLIWSPRSNIALYGDTARVSVAHRLGVNVALGTDWIPTGSMNMLRELACADTFNANYLGHHFSDTELWQMATRNAADVLGFGDILGRLAPGYWGDIAVFERGARRDHRAVIEGAPERIALVIRGGKPLYGDNSVINTLVGTSCDLLDVCGVSKRVCTQSEIGMSLAALQAANPPPTYPAFFCGTPSNEPTCIPSRSASVNGSSVYNGSPSASDADGDSIADTTDKCSGVFDPIRPVDNSLQGDADADNMGDACDPCPLNPGIICSCSPNWGDCDGFAGNGCETNFLRDPYNCGGCGVVCPTGQACVSGTCECPAWQTACNNTCVDTQTDPNNCGGCGAVCPTWQSCVSGTCECPAWQTACNNTCVDTQTDPNNCGGCGGVCPTGQPCASGTCCLTGQTVCSNTCVDTQTDPNNCGGCGGVCPTGQTCVSGTCGCPTGQTLCNNTCVDTQADPNNCGGCGVLCPPQYSCVSSECTPLVSRLGLMLNEVDYDQVATDTAEFVEIFNAGAESISLDGIAVVFVNGSGNTEYSRVNLSGVLSAGGYAVIIGPDVVPQAGSLIFTFPTSQNNIQNGSPDGIAIVDTYTGELLDALSYEGSITVVTIDGIGTVSLVEGIALSADRIPQQDLSPAFRTV